jgi:hypothetical protein
LLLTLTANFWVEAEALRPFTVAMVPSFVEPLRWTWARTISVHFSLHRTRGVRPLPVSSERRTLVPSFEIVIFGAVRSLATGG